MYQMKKQDKTPEKQLNEVEIGNLPEKEFRIMIVKMIQDLGKRMEANIEKMQEMFNKDLEELKNKQTEMNNTLTEMKNTLEGIHSIMTEADEQISDLEDRMVDFIAVEENKEKRMKRNEDSLRYLWDNIKRNNLHIIGVPEGKEGEKGPKKIFEDIIVKNFPKMGKEIATQVQDVQRVPYRITEAEEQISDLEDKIEEITATEENKEEKNEKK